MNTASHIRAQLEQLRQFNENREMEVGIAKAEALIAYIRDQPHYLETWLEPYVDTAQQLVGFLYFSSLYKDAVAIGDTVIGEIEHTKSPARDENLVKLLYTVSAPLMCLGRIDEAFSCLHRAYVILDTGVGGKGAMSKVVNNLSVLYGEIEEYEKSIFWQKKALEIDIELGQMLNIIICYSNLTAAYWMMEAYDEAIQYGERCISTVQPIVDSEEDVAKARIEVVFGHVHMNLGYAYLRKGDLIQARHYLERALEINRENDEIGHFHALSGLGELAIEQGECAVAIDHLTDALEIADRLQIPTKTSVCCKHLAEAHNLNGNHSLAFHYHKRYHELHMVVHGEQKQRSLERIEVKHRTEIAQMEAKKMRIENEALEQLVQERVIDLKQSLAREAKLSGQLEDALRVTEQINGVRTEMINTIAHEFRTPLTIINTSTNLLKNYYDRFPQEKREKHFASIEQSVHNLQGMLERSIQIDQFKIDPVETADNSIPFATLCTEIKTALTAEHPSRLAISFDGNAEQIVPIDVTLLIQGLMPLVDNALTYSDDEVNINVKLSLGKTLKVIIEDRGMGVTAEEMSHIFDLFYRSTRAQFLRGLGLGLYTARHVVQLLGGAITADSDGTDKGATFIVTV